MIPATFIYLEALPLTPNGKINNAALPQPELQREDLVIAPRDELERMLVEIWQQVLQLESVGIEDDFFELGGHSLLAVKLFAEIEKTWQKSLPLSVLFHSRTIAELATVIRKRQYKEHSCLIPMQTQGHLPPLFFLPPAGGHMLVYERLARNLGKTQPIYGLEFQPASDSRIESIQTTISEFIRAIRQVQPKGPYYLLGLSLGGLLAWAVAEELNRQGESLGSVIILDRAAPGDTQRQTGFPRFISVALWVLYERVRHVWRISRDGLKQRFVAGRRRLTPKNVVTSSTHRNDQVQQQKLKQQIYDIVDSLKNSHKGSWQKRLDYWGAKLLSITETDYYVKQIYGQQLYIDDIGDFLDERTREVLQAKFNLLKDYQPSPLSCPVLLFRATERVPSFLNSLTMGWERFAQTELQVIQISGGHHTIVTSKELARHLRRFLER